MDKKINNFLSDSEIKELEINNLLTKSNIKKIFNSYPSQYIIGYVNFYGNKIKVNKNVLIPRYETETLIFKTLQYIKKLQLKKLKVLDLCTGSGCIAISIKKLIDCEVTASDISTKALKLAKTNAKENKVLINFIKSNLFSNVKHKKFDVIISNPPYIPDNTILPKIVSYEPTKALFGGNDGLKYIKNILDNYDKFLNKPGILALEIYDTHNKLLKEYLKDKNVKYKFEKDLANKNRYLFILNE